MTRAVPPKGRYLFVAYQLSMSQSHSAIHRSTPNMPASSSGEPAIS